MGSPAQHVNSMRGLIQGEIFKCLLKSLLICMNIVNHIFIRNGSLMQLHNETNFLHLIVWKSSWIFLLWGKSKNLSNRSPILLSPIVVSIYQHT